MKSWSACFLFCLIFAVGNNYLQAADRPNIILMLSDDQSWNGLSIRMHPDVPASKSQVCQTPHLAQLAEEGMRFSSAYSPASVCSPTRASLQTGMSPAKLRWTKAAPVMTEWDGFQLIPPRTEKSLSSQYFTIGEVLQKAGYLTAHLGKWHLQGGGPGSHGYDVHDGNIGNEYATRFADPNPVDIFGMSDRAELFMKQSLRASKPFYLQMSWHALHEAQNALEATKRKYQNVRAGDRAAIAEDLDTGVGQVLAAVESLNLADDTYVIYMSDNGGGGGKGPGSLTGGKGSVWEGGIRIPFIIRGPGIAANSWCHTPIVGYDLFPTFCEWAGVKRLPDGLQGGSIIRLLENPRISQVERPADFLVFHFPHYQSGDAPHSSIRAGDWKLIHFYETGTNSLFNLKSDLSERNDLSRQQPEITRQLSDRMTQYLKEMDAGLPRENPSYDPNNPPSLRQQGSGKPERNRPMKRNRPGQKPRKRMS